MTFLQFFIYTTLSNLIYSGIIVGGSVIKARLSKNKIDSLIKSGQVKIMTMEEALEQLQNEDKKTWN